LPFKIGTFSGTVSLFSFKLNVGSRLYSFHTFSRFTFNLSYGLFESVKCALYIFKRFLITQVLACIQTLPFQFANVLSRDWKSDCLYLGKLHLKRNIISKYFPAERDHLRVPFGKGRYESDFMNPAPGSSALFLLLEVGVLEFGSSGGLEVLGKGAEMWSKPASQVLISSGAVQKGGFRRKRASKQLDWLHFMVHFACLRWAEAWTPVSRKKKM